MEYTENDDFIETQQIEKDDETQTLLKPCMTEREEIQWYNLNFLRVILIFACMLFSTIISTHLNVPYPAHSINCHDFHPVSFTTNKTASINQELVAYYQCYSRPKAVTDTLSSVRRFYPDMRIVMYNDGGDRNLSHIASSYGTEYYYGEKSATVDTALYFSCADHAKEFFQRILEVAKSGQGNDWVLLLEDDVRVLKSIDMHSLKHDLNGVYDLNHLRPCFVRVIESVIQKRMDQNFYGCAGGCILSGEFLRNISRLDKWRNMIDRLHDANLKIASDEMISALTYMHGGSLGQYRGYCDTDWWEYILWRRWTDSIEVLHGDKSSYTK